MPELECVVVYEYKAKLEDELSLCVGDIITKVQRREGGWWYGKLGEREGVFPVNFVKINPSAESEVLLRNGRYVRVKYPYKAVHAEELELLVGDLVEVLVEQREPGWWKGRIGDRVGIFPSTFVSDPLSKEDISNLTSAVGCSPVVLRRNSSKVKSIHASLDKNISHPISSNLFDPEDEPLGPMFGSLSSQLEKDWSSGSLSSSKQGLFTRIRHSFSGKFLLPKFLSGRLSSGSLFETRSVCTPSPMMTRRNSIAAFFRRSPSSATSSKQDLKESGKPDRTSRSFDLPTVTGLPGLKPLHSTPVIKLEGDFRKISLSSDSRRTGRDPEQSLSWVWQEVGSKTDVMPSSTLTPTTTRAPITSGDSGVGGSEIRGDSPEEVFGPVMDITDEVFEDMFNSPKFNVSNLRSPNYANCPIFDFSEVLEDNLKFEKKVTPSKIRTSFSSIDPRREIKRNSTPTNPFVSWKPAESAIKHKSVQITEI